MTVRTVTRVLFGEHEAIRAALAELVAHLDAGDPRGLPARLGELELLLRAHRGKVDRGLLPALARCGPRAEAEVRDVLRAHEGLDELFDGIETLLHETVGEPAARRPLEAAVRRFAAELGAHLDLEERTVLARAEREIPDAVKWELLQEMESGDRAAGGPY